MPYNTTLLDLDITGQNPQNLIVDEPHTLSGASNRSIAPGYGPFFSQSLIVRDGSTVLERGADYQIVELHQEATLKYGKEIASVILVINSNISSNVSITYQALGGHYSYNDSVIANMYQSVINDNRPVDWTNVLNKPTEYPPTLHRHLLEDLYGFEPIVDLLERIKRAITIGQSNILVQAVTSILGNYTCKELQLNLPTTTVLTHDALLYMLSRRKILSDVWIDISDCTLDQGRVSYIQVDTTSISTNTTLYWEFYSPNGTVIPMSPSAGSIVSDGTIMNVPIYVSTSIDTNDDMYLGLKDTPDREDYIAISYKIKTNKVNTTSNPPPILDSPIDPIILSIPYGYTDDNNDFRIWYTATYY